MGVRTFGHKSTSSNPKNEKNEKEPNDARNTSRSVKPLDTITPHSVTSTLPQPLTMYSRPTALHQSSREGFPEAPCLLAAVADGQPTHPQPPWQRDTVPVFSGFEPLPSRTSLSYAMDENDASYGECSLSSAARSLHPVDSDQDCCSVISELSYDDTVHPLHSATTTCPCSSTLSFPWTFVIRNQSIRYDQIHIGRSVASWDPLLSFRRHAVAHSQVAATMTRATKP